MLFFSKVSITYKLLMKRPPLAVFSKITVTHKLLMKRLPLVVPFIFQKDVVVTLLGNKVLLQREP